MVSGVVQKLRGEALVDRVIEDSRSHAGQGVSVGRPENPDVNVH